MADDIFAYIQNAPDSVVRSVLAGLCADEKVRCKATTLIDRLLQASRAGAKRKLPSTEFFICINCKAAYSEADNASTACCYHPGYLEVDYDNGAWEDHPSWLEMDTEDMREDNPLGFTWDCCEQAGDAPGCTLNWHQQGGVKRARFDPQPSAVIPISSDESADSSEEEDDDDTVTDESLVNTEGEEEEGEEEGEEEAEDGE